MKRRELLIVAGGVVAGAAVGAGVRATSSTATALRPPGALPEPDFAAACIECFRCAEVCPPQAIALSPLPTIAPAQAACTLCMRCGPVCPTGAIAVVADADVAAVVRIGAPVLDEHRCRAHNGKPCRLCSDVCPITGAVAVDAYVAPHFHESVCVGCGLCEQACPTSPPAIRIVAPSARRA